VAIHQSDWDSISPERKRRFLARVRNVKLRCLDCFEQLTLAERLQDRAYCESCWPEETEFDKESVP